MQAVIDKIRRQAVMAEAISRKTDAAEKRILESAEARLADVEDRIARLAPTAVMRHADGEEYMQLIEERGRLYRVIELSKHNLGGRPVGRDSTVPMSGSPEGRR